MNRGSMSYVIRNMQIKIMSKTRHLSEWRQGQRWRLDGVEQRSSFLVLKDRLADPRNTTLCLTT